MIFPFLSYILSSYFFLSKSVDLVLLNNDDIYKYKRMQQNTDSMQTRKQKVFVVFVVAV